MLLRVVSTSQRGFAAWAASTIARVFVATADIWSNTLRHTFHAACRSPAVPRTRKNASPAVARSPSRRASTTSQPSFPMIRATGQHAVFAREVLHLARLVADAQHRARQIDVRHVLRDEPVDARIGNPQHAAPSLFTIVSISE